MTIETVIDRLYETFANVEPPAEISGCREDGDLSPAEGCTLVEADLRKTPPNLVEKFANNFYFVGDPGSIRFFLPRIFELVLANKIIIDLPFQFFGALKEIDFDTPQKEALGRVFVQIFGKVTDGSLTYFLLDWLEGAARSKLPVKPMLDMLDHPLNCSAKTSFFQNELGFNIPSSGPLSRNQDFIDWFKANIDQILDP